MSAEVENNEVQPESAQQEAAPEIILDNGAPMADGSSTEVDVASLLESERNRADEAERRVLYIQAEFQNFRRRKDEETREIQKFANGELLKQFLPIVDNIERAIAAAEQTHNMDALLAGLAGTMKQIQAYLQKAGVEPIAALGQEFDPKFHEAIGHTESDEYPPHTVAEEVQKGYVMQERVLRPALVKVTEG